MRGFEQHSRAMYCGAMCFPIVLIIALAIAIKQGRTAGQWTPARPAFDERSTIPPLERDPQGVAEKEAGTLDTCIDIYHASSLTHLGLPGLM